MIVDYQTISGSAKEDVDFDQTRQTPLAPAERADAPALLIKLPAEASVILPPLVIITRAFQVSIREAERDSRKAVGEMNTHLQEALRGDPDALLEAGRLDLLVSDRLKPPPGRPRH